MTTSTVVKTVDRTLARSRLLAASQEAVTRLEAALAAGWDVAKELELERARVKAFGG